MNQQVQLISHDTIPLRDAQPEKRLEALPWWTEPSGADSDGQNTGIPGSWFGSPGLKHEAMGLA